MMYMALISHKNLILNRATRAWLLLIDIIVIILLLTSFILFYLYPLKKETATISMLPNIEQNMTITLDEFMHMAEEDIAEESTVFNIFMDVTLEDRLKQLSSTVGDPIFIRIFKEESILEVWIRTQAEYEHLKDYTICNYSGGLGPKLKEGDRQSPEGFYRVKKQQLNPNSKFHLAFNLGYPNRYDRANNHTGSYLMVHGNCVSIGCYAMTDQKMEEIYALVEGALDNEQTYVQVHAFPFRMTQENMARHSEHEWYDFWSELKDGYDYFEAEKLPPHIRVENRHYTVFEANE